jgi:hypothetical protein
MMNQRLYVRSVCGVLLGLSVGLAGCSDLGAPDDVTNAQEKMRENRGVPDPTQLPPGLGDDLPPPVTPTQPPPPSAPTLTP